MKTILIPLCLAFLFSVPLSAQERIVKGTVTDDNGNPLASVAVLIKNTYRGSSTDVNGSYQLKAESGDVLQFSMLGFSKREVLVGNQQIIDVSLSEGINIHEVAVLGSRNALRITTETAVPMDILDIREIAANAPQVSLNQILNYVAPSFSSNPQTISDGTDHIDPASLRGLGPDHVLVLINGKRRHTSSMVNVNGTVGRGSVGTDLNSIPVVAIQRIEVLRDGASAQYGSDAIAGVINIVLKENINELNFSYTSGANFTSEGEELDGQKNALSASYGVPLGKDGGALVFSGEVNLREPTDRTGDFEGQIFSRYNTVERLAFSDGYDLSGLSLDVISDYAIGLGFDETSQDIDPGMTALQSYLNDDVTDDELMARGFNRSDFNMRTGQSRLREGKFFANFSLPLGETAKIYSFSGISYRTGNSGGFYRLPYQSRTYTPIFINGFIPEINSQIVDKSLSIGIKGLVKNWTVDFSNTYGSNSFMHVIGNTVNASMESNSPIMIDAGGHSFMQNTTNLDVSRFWKDVFSGLNIAWGLEHRLENYQIYAGEESSYALYNINGDVTSSHPDPNLTVTDFFGSSRPGGVQVFPGFRPANELNRYRNNLAAYADLELDLSKKFMLNAAIRYENYSDFGGTMNYKIASRYKIAKNFMVRAAHSTGFRAPSLHQLYFNRVNTQFVGGQPFEIGTFANDSKLARLLGIPELKHERSQNYSGGFSMRIPAWNVSMSIDAFQISIYDRITYTGSFSAGNSIEDAELAAILTQVGASSATFFSNTIDARSRGIDVVFSYHSKLGQGKIRSDFSATLSETHQIGDIHASDLLANKLDTYFNEFDRVLLESASPKTKMSLSYSYSLKGFTVLLRESYFGKVTHASRIVADQQVLPAKFLVDLSLAYTIKDNLTLCIGANNLLDTYPDMILPDNADYSSGRFPYSRRSTQFGFAGRFLFARATFGL
ncbi:MAG: TonB-dependent receptor [Bacteroidetes bacterium]|nr:TonB-dependent receptor [Bacteroidota bacterium]MBT7094282.1 TonB-dependent receptor [Bacteroidota bacterium]MBT7464452.1 TonB-dependent receptor [Bacteroidota bacterium]